MRLAAHRILSTGLARAAVMVTAIPDSPTTRRWEISVDHPRAGAPFGGRHGVDDAER